MYDYLEQVTADVRDYVEQEIDLTEWAGNRDGLEEKLNDDLWTCDSVTGNASGSYYCNAWKAEEALAHNWDLLAEALEEFGQDGTDVLKKKRRGSYGRYNSLLPVRAGNSRRIR